MDAERDKVLELADDFEILGVKLALVVIDILRVTETLAVDDMLASERDAVVVTLVRFHADGDAVRLPTISEADDNGDEVCAETKSAIAKRNNAFRLLIGVAMKGFYVVNPPEVAAKDTESAAKRLGGYDRQRDEYRCDVGAAASGQESGQLPNLRAYRLPTVL